MTIAIYLYSGRLKYWTLPRLHSHINHTQYPILYPESSMSVSTVEFAPLLAINDPDADTHGYHSG